MPTSSITSPQHTNHKLLAVILVNALMFVAALQTPFSGWFILGSFLIESTILGMICIITIIRLGIQKRAVLKTVGNLAIFTLPYFSFILFGLSFIAFTLDSLPFDLNDFKPQAPVDSFSTFLAISTAMFVAYSKANLFFVQENFLFVFYSLLIIHSFTYLSEVRQKKLDPKMYFGSILGSSTLRLMFIYILIAISGMFSLPNNFYSGENPVGIWSVVLLLFFTILKLLFDLYEYKKDQRKAEDAYLLSMNHKRETPLRF